MFPAVETGQVEGITTLRPIVRVVLEVLASQNLRVRLKTHPTITSNSRGREAACFKLVVNFEAGTKRDAGGSSEAASAA